MYKIIAWIGKLLNIGYILYEIYGNHSYDTLITRKIFAIRKSSLISIARNSEFNCLITKVRW